MAVQVLEIPAVRAGGGAAPSAWLDAAAVGRPGQRPGRRVLVGRGLAAVMTETIEPDRVRVRLEYVGN